MPATFIYVRFCPRKRARDRRCFGQKLSYSTHVARVFVGLSGGWSAVNPNFRTDTSPLCCWAATQLSHMHTPHHTAQYTTPHPPTQPPTHTHTLSLPPRLTRTAAHVQPAVRLQDVLQHPDQGRASVGGPTSRPCHRSRLSCWCWSLVGFTWDPCPPLLLLILRLLQLTYTPDWSVRLQLIRKR
jgi:hypothetical protein